MSRLVSDFYHTLQRTFVTFLSVIRVELLIVPSAIKNEMSGAIAIPQGLFNKGNRGILRTKGGGAAVPVPWQAQETPLAWQESGSGIRIFSTIK